MRPFLSHEYPYPATTPLMRRLVNLVKLFAERSNVELVGPWVFP